MLTLCMDAIGVVCLGFGSGRRIGADEADGSQAPLHSKLLAQYEAERALATTELRSDADPLGSTIPSPPLASTRSPSPANAAYDPKLRTSVQISTS